jgi:hypothetical protein
MSNYATITDIQSLKRSMSNAEQTRAEALIPLVCSLIRFEAKKTGRDYDQMIYESELVPVIDAFTGNGEDVSFTLSSNPQGSVMVTVGGEEATDYTTSGTTLTFTTAPAGEILVSYAYRALAEVARAVVCDVVMRELNTPGTQLPATSYSEGAGGVTQSYTLPNSSGAIKLWPSDLKALGLKRQKIDSLNLMKRGC